MVELWILGAEANAVSKLPAIASVVRASSCQDASLNVASCKFATVKVTLASLRKRPLQRPTRCLRFGTGAWLNLESCHVIVSLLHSSICDWDSGALKDVLSPLLPSATSQLKKLQDGAYVYGCLCLCSPWKFMVVYQRIWLQSCRVRRFRCSPKKKVRNACATCGINLNH